MQPTDPLLDVLVDLIGNAQWLPLLVIVAGLFGRLLKRDVRWFPTIPPQYRAWAVVGFGLIESALGSVAKGASWKTAIVGGFIAAFGAISGHELLIESVRKGREIGEPKSGGTDGDGGGTFVPKLPTLAMGAWLLAIVLGLVIAVAA